ncbi:hypothetical protein JD276_08845 [Leucobacter sp. CSA1]|uniref:Uncharacterized protein n=1 Tax=Leucobacter chromiisoli TaxID=2796471 RepID=A0A934Q895_9MICO|nr:hypothetical protein [Leucobacter chromiisoli]MBK0419140.1 hypothetical protein [Leucobacter chromiisoli]
MTERNSHPSTTPLDQNRSFPSGVTVLRLEMLNGADGMAEFYSPAPQKIKAVLPRAAFQQVMEKLPEVFDDAAWLEVTLLKDVGGILELAVEDQLKHRVFVAEGLFDDMSAFVWDNAPSSCSQRDPLAATRTRFRY